MNQDLWKPSATLERLKQRAQFMSQIRTFFQQRHYLEVETPVMAQYGVTDVYLSNVKAQFRHRDYYLQTSPEYHMKRLLAAGSGPIFQLARVFRDDELGRWHNPEFTLLEWYQLNCDHHALLQELSELLSFVAQTPPVIKKTYTEVFQEACDIAPFRASLDELKKTAARFDCFLSENQAMCEAHEKEVYLFLLMSHVVEPYLAKQPAPVAVYDFPASQAQLARVNNQIASRFEVYYQGVELANGFHELCDAVEQTKRFAADEWKREQLGLPSMPTDPYLLAALAHGLPPCSGVALGVDRLLALSLQCDNLSEVLSFDHARA